MRRSDCQVFQAVEAGQEVFLVAGPETVDGIDFWQVAGDGFTDCCAPLGWIPDERLGRPLLEPLAIECPDADATLAPTHVLELGLIASLSCFGSRELTLTGLASCPYGIADGPVFIGGPDWADLEQGLFCSLKSDDAAAGEELRMFEAPETFQPFGERRARVVGHFDDPQSDTCHWTRGNFAPFPIDGVSNEPAAFICRTHFVVSFLDFLQ
jgi:hypothetical protein